MKAIRTKYLCPTDYRGARIKASEPDGQSVTIPYPYELSGEDAHRVAAKALRDRMGWSGTLAGGYVGTRDVRYAFVFVA